MTTRSCIVSCLTAAAVAALATAPAAAAPAQPGATRPRIDLDAVQGLLAVQRLDGWLLYDFRGQNPIAQELVSPEGHQTRRWFYFIPAEGQPVALVHKIEAANFARVPGRKIEYAGWRELDAGLRELLRGSRKVAMEYSPQGAIPALSRVDAGTFERVRRVGGVKIVSSADLVQYTKAIWGDAGRKAHAVAVHHLVQIRKEALAWLAREVRAGRDVTEWDLQQRMYRAYAVRGLEGEPPIVAVNANAADPHYYPTREAAAHIREGDLLLVDMWAKSLDVDRGIYADMTWMAYVGSDVPNRYVRAFEVVAKARDATVAFIDGRIKRRRVVRGYEADQQARSIVAAAGFGDKFIHRTGHSIDTDVHGAGAHLDDYETHDTRPLVRGAGFSVEPGIYVRGDFGVRSEIDVYVGARGVEVTTPVQREIEALLR